MVEPHYIDLELDDKFEKAFPDHKLPVGVIDKTKTRIGITYSAFHANQHSITVVPNVPIIDDAYNNYPELDLFRVYDAVDVSQIDEYLKRKDLTYKRLVCTPESFGKIISAAIELRNTKWLYNEFFLYLDEVHCYATEAYREDILTPFIWVEYFRNVSYGSATPFPTTDTVQLSMPHYKVRYDKKFGKITIVHHAHPRDVLIYMCKHPELFPGRVHVFLNTVTGCGEVITLADLNEETASVYCRDEERNITNLGAAGVCFHSSPSKDNYRKFNFYSCRYNEGWALEDDETATIILVTDTRIPHSVMGIEWKGAQAIGRLNYTNMQRIHITNTYGKKEMKDIYTVQQNTLFNSKKYIECYNNHLDECNRSNQEYDGRLDGLLKDFTDIDNDGKAKLNHRKHDQIVYKAYYKEPYSNINTLKSTWQSMNYDVEVKTFDIETIERKDKSQNEINRQVIQRFMEFNNNPNGYVYDMAALTIKGFKTKYPLLLEALAVLGIDELEKLNYDNKAMKTALIDKNNSNAEAKVRLKLLELFEIGDRYTKREMKVMIQKVYNDYKLLKTDGTIRTAKAKDLQNLGLFELEDCKIPVTGEPKKVNGFELIRCHASVSKAA